jgi:hypothetical protein
MSQITVFSDDMGMWQHVVDTTGLEVEIRSLFDRENCDSSVVLIDARHSQEGDALLSVMDKALVSAHLGPGPSPYGRSERKFVFRPFQAERFGSLVIQHAVLSVSAPEECGFPVVTHGPGICGEQGRPVLWETRPFLGLGVSVPRDDKAVVSSIYDGIQGHRPLWFQPGFPGLIPPAPTPFRVFDGSMERGVLCASIERPGGWSVLRAADLQALLGYGSLHPMDWREVAALLPYQAAQALLVWLFNCLQALESLAPVLLGPDDSSGPLALTQDLVLDEGTDTTPTQKGKTR